jgi:hypothetical protein
MEVIKLDPEKQEEYSIKRTNKHVCFHKQIEVDVEEREVRCVKCNTVIDPFDFIHDLAASTENHLAYKFLLETEIKDFEQRKSRLEKDLVNLRGKIKRENIKAKDFLKSFLNEKKWDGIIHYGNNGEFSVDVSWVCDQYVRQIFGINNTE